LNPGRGIAFGRAHDSTTQRPRARSHAVRARYDGGLTDAGCRLGRAV